VPRRERRQPAFAETKESDGAAALCHRVTVTEEERAQALLPAQSAWPTDGAALSPVAYVALAAPLPSGAASSLAPPPNGAAPPPVACVAPPAPPPSGAAPPPSGAAPPPVACVAPPALPPSGGAPPPVACVVPPAPPPSDAAQPSKVPSLFVGNTTVTSFGWLARYCHAAERRARA
jgi:hypothetical protein